MGATGMIGKPVTRVLLQSPYDITIMARDEKKAKGIFPEANIVYGDVFDPFSLLPVLEGKDIVYISIGPERNPRKGDRMAEEEGLDNIVETAKQAGVKRLVFLSSLVQRYNNTNSFHWWIFDIKQRAIEKIKNSGLAYTIFYPSSFMENFDQLMMKGNKLMLAGKSMAPMYFIAGKDYGEQVLKSFSLPDHISKEYAVQGPEAYNWDDGCRVFIENFTARKLSVMKAPLGLLKMMAPFSRGASYGAKILEALNNYPEKFESQSTWDELGKPTTTIKDYARAVSEELKNK